MLTIITGTPGAGKTLFTLKWVKQLREEEPSRPVYIHGIPNVDLEYFGAELLEDAQKWHECPTGSIIVIDEAQEPGRFPMRMAGRDTPEWVSEIATHRHKGMDIFLTTQNAADLDIFVRRRCGRHLHVERILGREVATVFEYSKYVSDPTGYHERKTAIEVKPHKYPKEIYERYKSAELHTVKKRTPAKFYFIIGLAAAVVFLLWFGISRVANRAADMAEETPEVLTPSRSGQTVLNPDNAASFFSGNWLDRFAPQVPGFPQSAPIYDELLEAKAIPKPWCLIHELECRCYTQQLTTFETTDQACRYWVEHGFWDWTKEEPYEGGGGSRQAQAPATPPGREWEN